MRALPDLMPEVARLEPVRSLPAEARGPSNPYLEAVIRDGLLADSRSIEDVWLPRKWTDDHPEVREFHRRYGNRGHLCRTYSWAIPNERALARLAELAPIVELGAGGGYWAHLLRQRGADVVAYDRNPPPREGRTTGWSWRLWSEVIRAEALNVIDQHPDRTLLFCWPSPGHWESCWAAEVLRRSRNERLVFIGEEGGGAVGSYAFHGILEAHFELREEIAIPRHSGIGDRLTLYCR